MQALIDQIEQLIHRDVGRGMDAVFRAARGGLWGATRALAAMTAPRIGLITAAVPADQLMGTARQLAGQIAGHPPVAVRATKAAIDLGQQVDIDTGISIEVQVYSSCYESTGQREAMQAFLRKRSAG